jgi:hypothetical protein
MTLFARLLSALLLCSVACVAADAPASAQASTPAADKADAAKRKGKSGKAAAKQGEAKPVVGPHADFPLPGAATTARPQGVAAPEDGERVVLLGNGLAERDVYYGRI